MSDGKYTRRQACLPALMGVSPLRGSRRAVFQRKYHCLLLHIIATSGCSPGICSESYRSHYNGHGGSLRRLSEGYWFGTYLMQCICNCQCTAGSHPTAHLSVYKDLSLFFRVCEYRLVVVTRPLLHLPGNLNQLVCNSQ